MSNSFVRFWGVRGSYAAPFDSHLGVGGNTSCVEIRVGDHVVACDAGTGIIPLGNALLAEGKVKEMLIVLTHYHWDHICGLPFFVPAFTPDWKIRFFGPGEDDEDVQELLAHQMRAPYFPVETETWLADIKYLKPGQGGITHGDIKLDYFHVHHPGTTFGYRINAAGKTIVYASDNEFLFLERNIDARYEEFDDREKELLTSMKDEERNLALRFMQGVDILIHDAQYTPHDYEKKRGWGHSCYIDTVNCAIDGGIKELYLFHHDPNYDDAAMEEIHRKANEIVAERGSSMKCHIAREGDTIEL